MAKIKRNFSLHTQQAVLTVDFRSLVFPFLDWSLLGQPFIFRLLDQLIQDHHLLTDLIIVTPEEASDLRQLIRSYALQKPLKIRLVSSANPLNFKAVLLQLRHFLQPSFFLFTLDNQSANFQMTELLNWQAAAVFAVDQNEKLFHTYLFHQQFLTFLDQNDPALSWSSLLAQFAQNFPTKSVTFERSPADAKMTGSDFWLAHCQKSLATLHSQDFPLPNQVQLAPTVRISGDLTFTDNVRVGEFSLLAGPSYLGKNCQIGNFCHLQNVIIEGGAVLPDYSNLQDCYVAANTHLTKSFQSYQQQILQNKPTPTEKN